MSDEVDVTEISRLFEEIAPLLGNHPAPIQGAVLADLLATWLAGHFDQRGENATARMRRSLLTAHLKTVRKLIAVNEAMRRQGAH